MQCRLWCLCSQYEVSSCLVEQIFQESLLAFRKGSGIGHGCSKSLSKRALGGTQTGPEFFPTLSLPAAPVPPDPSSITVLWSVFCVFPLLFFWGLLLPVCSLRPYYLWVVGSPLQNSWKWTQGWSVVSLPVLLSEELCIPKMLLWEYTPMNIYFIYTLPVSHSRGQEAAYCTVLFIPPQKLYCRTRKGSEKSNP